MWLFEQFLCGISIYENVMPFTHLHLRKTLPANLCRDFFFVISIHWIATNKRFDIQSLREKLVEVSTFYTLFIENYIDKSINSIQCAFFLSHFRIKISKSKSKRSQESDLKKIIIDSNKNLDSSYKTYYDFLWIQYFNGVIFSWILHNV